MTAWTADIYAVVYMPDVSADAAYLCLKCGSTFLKKCGLCATFDAILESERQHTEE